MVRSLTNFFGSKPAVEFFWFYLVLLIPTIAGKMLYLDKLVFGGLPELAADIVPNHHWAVFFGLDYLQVLILALALYFTSRLLLRRYASQGLIVFALFLITVQLANWISTKELSTLVTPNSIAVSYSWVLDNPEHLSSYISRRRDLAILMLFSGLAVIWISLPWLVSRFCMRRESFRKFSMYINIATPCVLIIAVLATLSTQNLFAKSLPIPYSGYWGSTVESLFLATDSDLLRLEVPSKNELMGQYQDLVFPAGKGPERQIADGRNVGDFNKRHVLVLSLETAPAKYYQLTNNPSLPIFYKMSQNAIVSPSHLANSPFTTRAVYTMLSGVYPNAAGHIAKYGDFETDGLATVLGRNGYQTVYIDSYKIDWIRGMYIHKKTWRELGFDTLIENGERAELDGITDPYERKLIAEGLSLESAANQIISAHKQGEKALVFVASILGHYKWLARADQQQLNGKERLQNIAQQYDGLIGQFIERMQAHGILDEVMIVVTGDHGLRYQNEFDSLNEDIGNEEIAFNVPFFIYAPGQVSQQTTVRFVTSHVDITPTILQLNGIDTTGMLHHGLNILSEDLQYRATLMMNTRLSSVDRLHWRNTIVSYNNLTKRTEARAVKFGGRASESADNPIDYSSTGAVFPDVPGFFLQANNLFNQTATFFIKSAPAQAEHTEIELSEMGAMGIGSAEPGTPDRR